MTFAKLSVRGSSATSTREIFDKLTDIGKRRIAASLGIRKDVIRMDLDAYSVVISTRDMEREKDAFRLFLQSFAGESPVKCSFPKWATGAKTKEGMFGCNGNACQHLPTILQGKEMMVIDGPVKIALHISCKQRLIEWCVSNKIYLRAAPEGTGVCFDSNNAANSPAFVRLIDGLMECCGVPPEESECRETTYIVHVGEMGFRLPLPKFLVQSSKLVESSVRAGIKIEVAQFDIAFEAEMERNKLIQASCSGKPQKQPRLMLQDTSVNKYPLHHLPNISQCQGKGMNRNNLKGTVQVKKTNWKKGKEVKFPNEELDRGFDAIDLFSAKNESCNTREFITLSSSTPHSVKNYSTIAHVLLQGRSKYPLTFTDMYGVGKRSFQSLQRMVKNLDSDQQLAFSLAESDGFSSRFEVSVRPHFDDDLREKGHLNDILLVAILTLIEFCEVYKPTVTRLPLGNVQTEVMKLIHEARVMLRYAQGMKFENIFPSPKATEWLRSHMSQMLITIGICPSFHVKYINDWLKNKDRSDPYNKVESDKADIAWESSPNSGMRNLRTVLKGILRKLRFSRRAINTLETFVSDFAKKHANTQHFNSVQKCKKEGDPRTAYTSLSFRAKHMLAYLLPSKIIPALLDLDKAEDLEEQRRDDPVDFVPHPARETDDDNDQDRFGYYEGEWELDTGSKSHAAPEQYPLPKNPLGLALYSLQNMRLSWDHERHEFNQMTLSIYILKCHESTKLDHEGIVDEKTKNFLLQCSKGKKILTLQELQHLCYNLGIRSSTRSHKSRAEYLTLMREHYKFPCDGVLFVPGTMEEDRERNLLLNDVLHQDLVIIVSETNQRKTIQRFADNTSLDLLQTNEILSKETAPQFEKKKPIRTCTEFWAALSTPGKEIM